MRPRFVPHRHRRPQKGADCRLPGGKPGQPRFDTPNLYSGAQALLAVYAYSLQLYFDFSGYTDIARGAGLLLGIDLPGISTGLILR